MGCVIEWGGFPFYDRDGPQVDDARFETDFGLDLKSNFGRESSKILEFRSNFVRAFRAIT
jgi:hypothetical protein